MMEKKNAQTIYTAIPLLGKSDYLPRSLVRFDVTALIVLITWLWMLARWVVLDFKPKLVDEVLRVFL